MARYTGPKTRIARKFGEAIFVAKHPVTKPNLNIIKQHEHNLDDVIDELMKTAIETTEKTIPVKSIVIITIGSESAPSFAICLTVSFPSALLINLITPFDAKLIFSQETTKELPQKLA